MNDGLTGDDLHDAMKEKEEKGKGFNKKRKRRSKYFKHRTTSNMYAERIRNQYSGREIVIERWSLEEKKVVELKGRVIYTSGCRFDSHSPVHVIKMNDSDKQLVLIEGQFKFV